MALTNPFPLVGYHGPAYFCDRTQELERLVRATTSGSNITMMSLRRMGKSALLQHFMYNRRRKGIDCVYVDLQPTSDMAGCVSALAEAMARQLFGTGTKITTALQQFIGRIGATLQMSKEGIPSVTLRLHDQPTAATDTLAALFDVLETWKKPVVVAFDEFQQITRYPDANVEAQLRSLIQHMNTRFIFAGSHRELLQEIFADHKRPFYNSTEHLYLGPIDTTVYADFVRTWFTAVGRTITDDALATIQESVDRRTFHMQQICNRLYSGDETRIDAAVVRSYLQVLYGEQAHLYYGYRSLLTDAQWQVLMAIAMDRVVAEPYADGWRSKHGLPAVSTIKRALTALVDREFLIRGENGYQVEDPALAGWIRSTF